MTPDSSHGPRPEHAGAPGLHGPNDRTPGGGDLSINTGVYPAPPYELHSALMSSPGSEQPLHSGQVRSADSDHPAHSFLSPQAYQPPVSAAGYGGMAGLHRSNSDAQYLGDPGSMDGRNGPGGIRAGPGPAYNGARRPSYGLAGPQGANHVGSAAQVLPSSSAPSDPMQPYRRASHHLPSNHASRPDPGHPYLQSHNSFPLGPTAPLPNYGGLPPSEPYASAAPFYSAVAARGDDFGGLLQQHESPQTDHSFAMMDETYAARSPVLMPDDFTFWLFASGQGGAGAAGGDLAGGAPGAGGGRRPDSSMFDAPDLDVGLPPPPPPQQPMDVRNLLDPTPSTSQLSDDKRRELLKLIRLKFNETEHGPVARAKAQLLAGDVDADGHPLSLKSLKAYIWSYWDHFHGQLPLLHQPTFSADRTHNLLLLAIVVIGAANLEPDRFGPLSPLGADLAYFLAWHLRGEVFMSPDFRAPARLWVLQTLLLLECYEKLYSTRLLHERAQIHHAATIFLLRRGSALQGRSAFDPPPNGSSGTDAAAAKSGFMVDTPDPWWNHWITTEATKRVAHAAFIIDSTHATMFSHTAVMLASEMKLALPCDEALWTAPSGHEVRRLLDQGAPEARSVGFLDALKLTLNDGRVHTNVFGRTALMAGLLNVTLNLGQRDQLRQLTVQGKNERERWRGNLTRAFDVWEGDWDTRPATGSAASSAHATPNHHYSHPPPHPPPLSRPPSHLGGTPTTNNHTSSSSGGGGGGGPRRPDAGSKSDEPAFESRVVLHHLAHMGMHVDIVQCQIFAGARRLLGRAITPADYHATARRMRAHWAGRPSARDAVFYSLRFLALVLSKDLEDERPAARPTASAHAGAAGRPPSPDEYAPHNDYLLNRPWVLYFAALVVWSYGFALDGALGPHQRAQLGALATKAEQRRDARRYMRRVGGVARPDDLERVRDRNGCVGLLVFLAGQFAECRWELMHEASERLRTCVEMLMGRWEPGS